MVILFRAPEECIPSLVSRFRPNLIEAVQRYVHFYRFVVDEVRMDALLVSFEEATTDVTRTVRRAARFAGLTVNEDSLLGAEEQAVRRIREWTRESGVDERIPLPREGREEMKANVLVELKRLFEYQEARSLYVELQHLYDQQRQAESAA